MILKGYSDGETYNHCYLAYHTKQTDRCFQSVYCQASSYFDECVAQKNETCRLPAKPLQDSITSMLSKPSISAGLGIVYRLEPVRIEMNFGLPLVAAKGEGARRGFQLGIGLEFL